MQYLTEELAWQDRQVSFAAAKAEDFERLLDLRIRVQRAHLERLGRFHPDRARARFAATFDPTRTRLFHVNDRFAGCISVFERGAALEIGQFYIEPAFQSGGLGGVILTALLAQVDAERREMILDVIIGSPANRFYQRHGFVEDRRDDFDIYYRRLPNHSSTTTTKGRV